MSRNLKDRQFFTRNIEEKNWKVLYLHIHSDLALKRYRKLRTQNY